MPRLSSKPSSLLNRRSKMADEITLEVQLDLPLDTDDIDSYHAYITSGRTAYEAAAQVAQDLLGGTGAVVQGAEAVPS